MNKWSKGCNSYLRKLHELGKTLGRNSSLSRNIKANNFRISGNQLVKDVSMALRQKNGSAILSTEPILIFNAKEVKGLNEGRSKIAIGGKIIFKDGVLSQQAIHLLILFTPDKDINNLKAGRTYIVRKIHFDFDRKNIEEGKPTSHMQVGGKIATEMVPYFDEIKDVRSETFDQIDLPRIPSPPYGLASVLDMALREFAPENLKAFTDEKHWNELVSETETILLSNYHSSLADELKSTSDCTNYDYHCKEVICEM
jgi:hypothetical protein